MSQQLKYSPGFHAYFIGQYQSKNIHQQAGLIPVPAALKSHLARFAQPRSKAGLRHSERDGKGVTSAEEPMQYYKNKDLCVEGK